MSYKAYINTFKIAQSKPKLIGGIVVNKNLMNNGFSRSSLSSSIFPVLYDLSDSLNC